MEIIYGSLEIWGLIISPFSPPLLAKIVGKPSIISKNNKDLLGSVIKVANWLPDGLTDC